MCSSLYKKEFHLILARNMWHTANSNWESFDDKLYIAFKIFKTLNSVQWWFVPNYLVFRYLILNAHCYDWSTISQICNCSNDNRTKTSNWRICDNDINLQNYLNVHILRIEYLIEFVWVYCCKASYRKYKKKSILFYILIKFIKKNCYMKGFLCY